VSELSELGAPIVAVTVYRDSARVTRRGRVRLAAGDHTVAVEPLPLYLRPDSIRVSGHGPATVLGVDVTRRHQPRTTDAAVAQLEEERRELRGRLSELDDADAVETQRLDFLQQLASRAGGNYARALATGGTEPAAVAAFADGLAEQVAAVQARQRALARRREELTDELAACDRKLQDVAVAREPDRMAALVSLAIETEAGAEAEVEVELSYVVGGAGWESAYDLRLDETDRLTVTWYGLIRQHTSEDWPECDLRLSTARPSATATVPELDPWYLERIRPIVVARPVARSRGLAGMLPGAAPAPAPAAAYDAAAMLDKEEAPPVAEVAATVEQGVAAATYQPARPVAVPADGSAHRATVAVFDLESTLDYVTAPVLAEEAHLRATATNSSPHTLLPGTASVFHGPDFVGSTKLDTWAPGEEVELALGIDDRVRVERKLVRRTATKVTLGTTRRREAEYRITVANHTPRPADVTVLDQLPVSRDEQISVKEVRAEPAPAERTELGVLTWKLALAPNESRDVHLGFRVELAKGVELAGWRE
jgi:uncharacterized protein (TIGR02231 family)